jgi:hypothetical protein
VFAQAFALGPIGEKLPSVVSAKGRVACHLDLLLIKVVRVLSGFLVVSWCFFWFDPEFLLDNYGSFVESSTNQGAAMHLESHALALRASLNGNFNR